MTRPIFNLRRKQTKNYAFPKVFSLLEKCGYKQKTYSKLFLIFNYNNFIIIYFNITREIFFKIHF